MHTFDRATEVYLTQVMRVSETAWREGMRAFGSVKPQQVVIWEDLADPKTLLLTSNAETVYALTHLALQSDGPTVVEAPPNMLGFPFFRFYGPTEAFYDQTWTLDDVVAMRPYCPVHGSC